MSKEFLNIKAVSQLTGISQHTLRAWEKRYKTIEPSRTSTGRRVYSMEDVERLKLINLLVNSGYTISAIAKFTLSELRKHGAGSSIVHKHPFIDAGSDRAILVKELLQCLEDWDLDGVSKTLTKARMCLPITTLVYEVFSPVLNRIGVLVEEGKLGIAEEHSFSAILRNHLGEIFQSAREISLTRRTSVVLATREGDLHEFGLLLSAILCAAHGLEVFYLGPNVPAQEVCRVLERTNSKILVLAITDLPDPGAAGAALKYIEKIKREISPEVSVWIGGSGAPKRSETSKTRVFDSLAALETSLKNLT